ncbi:unnamed protein product [Meganyctiphanes norvegica]|uniref:Peptidase S1 domain-containing protein n=1 Tax=Meganyctiphanes norvegica TaxID=48144 RepID=A0AAV2S8H0_MEGNR
MAITYAIFSLMFSGLTQAGVSPFEGSSDMMMDMIPEEMLIKSIINPDASDILDSVAKNMQSVDTSKSHLNDTEPLQAVFKQLNRPFSGCGRNPRVDGGGGDLAPWMVALGSKSNGIFSVSGMGILVSSQHVVSNAVQIEKFKRIHVQLGTAVRVPGPNAVERQVQVITFPPELQRNDALKFVGYNIAVLTLDNPVDFNDFIQPACLPKPVTNETAYIVQFEEGASVYGFDLEILSRSPEIIIGNKYAVNDAIYLGPAICKYFIEEKPEFGLNSKVADLLTTWTICAPNIHGNKVLTSALLDKDSAGRVTLIGVGPLAPKGIDRPTVYSSVPIHLDWINSVIQSKPSNGKIRG